MKTYVPEYSSHRLSKDKFFSIDEKTMVKVISDRGYELFTQQNVEADGESFE